MCCKTGRCITPRDQCRSSFVLDELGIFRFLALWTLIGSRIIINTLQLWLCITQFCPDEFVSDRNHHCSTNITRFLFFRKSIYINILCRKISKDLIISSFRFTGLLVCFYLNVFPPQGAPVPVHPPSAGGTDPTVPGTVHAGSHWWSQKVWSSGSPTVPEG